jgi:spore coat protein U-like protein
MKLIKFAALILIVSSCITANATPTSCSVSAVGVAFGSYKPIDNVNSDGTGSISMTCSGTSSVSYTLSASTGNGSYTTRQQVSGNNKLNYNMFIDNSRTLVWGDGTSGTSKISGSATASPTGVTQRYTVYSRIFAGQQNVRVGTYSDTLMITVTYSLASWFI